MRRQTRWPHVCPEVEKAQEEGNGAGRIGRKPRQGSVAQVVERLVDQVDALRGPGRSAPSLPRLRTRGTNGVVRNGRRQEEAVPA